MEFFFFFFFFLTVKVYCKLECTHSVCTGKKYGIIVKAKHLGFCHAMTDRFATRIQVDRQPSKNPF